MLYIVVGLVLIIFAIRSFYNKKQKDLISYYQQKESKQGDTFANYLKQLDDKNYKLKQENMKLKNKLT